MTLNYTCLGSNDEIRKRRYNVLTFFIKGAIPDEIVRFTNENPNIESITTKQVYNDLSYLRSHPLHDLPIDMVRDFGKSFYELKVTELERKLKKNESNPAVWLGIQKLIREYKGDSLKLQGLMSEKVEHSGTIVTIIDNIPENNDKSTT